MPANTTVLQLPYPVPDDTVDVPRDVKALAEKLDATSSLKPPARATLPGSPAVGDEIYYTGQAGCLWHLRFGGTAWQFLGGGDQFSTVGNPAAGIAGGGGWTAWPGGPQLTLTAPGTYAVTSAGFRCQQMSAGSIDVSLAIGANGVMQPGTRAGLIGITQYQAVPVPIHGFFTATAGAALTVVHLVNAGQTLDLGGPSATTFLFGRS